LKIIGHGNPDNNFESSFIMEIGWEAVDWVHLQDMDEWQTLVNTVLNLQIP
jgi:hypothetical protein